MRIVEKHSHINGEEYLIVHYNDIYKEIMDIINNVDERQLRTGIRMRKSKESRVLYSLEELNREFRNLLNHKGWRQIRCPYYVTIDYSTVQELISVPLENQRELLVDRGVASPILSYKQIDFVKRDVAVEVRFEECAYVAYDLFVKYPFFYNSGVISVGIEIIPMKCMLAEMSPEIAYYENEVYNVLRHGRNNPPVPLLIVGIAP